MLAETVIAAPASALAVPLAGAPATAQESIAIDSRQAEVNGTMVAYLIGGSGDPILLHGYAQNSHMWRPLIARACEDPYSDRSRPAGIRPVFETRERLRQEDDGPGHPCACGFARP